MRQSRRSVSWTAIGSFSFFDLVVISRNIKILSYIVENYKETITPEVLGEGIKVEYDESIDTSIDFVDENGIEKINKRTFNRVKRHHINNNYEGEKTIFFHKFDFHINHRYYTYT